MISRCSSEFVLLNGATGEGKFLNLKVARPTGIKPESAKNTDEAEEPDVIDISKLKKIGE